MPAAPEQPPYTRLSSSEAFSCPWYHIRHDRYTLPDGQVGDYYVVVTGGASMVVPTLPDGRVMLVEQFRYITQERSIEFPCGGIEDGERPEDAAARECQEECGGVGPLTAIGRFVPHNGVSDEHCMVYRMDVTDRVSIAGDEEEHIMQVHELTPQEVDDMIVAGQITDGMTMAAWQLYKLHTRSQ